MIINYPSIKERIKCAYKTGGFATLLVRTLKKLKNTLFRFHTSYWYMRDLREPFENITPKINVDINYNCMEEVLNWEINNVNKGIFSFEAYKETKIAKEYKHNFITVKHNNEILGFLKIGFDKVYLKEYIKNIIIPSDIAFIYDTYIHPDFRGKNIASFMINEVMKKLYSEGFKWVLCHIVPDNLASQKAYDKVGFKKVKYILHWRIFGLKIFNYSPQRLINYNTKEAHI